LRFASFSCFLIKQKAKDEAAAKQKQQDEAAKKAADQAAQTNKSGGDKS